MPTLIPLALNTGFYIEYLIREFKTMKDKREIWPVYIEFGIPAIIGIALPAAIVFVMRHNVIHHLVLSCVSSLVFLAIGINIIRFIIKKQIDKVFLLTVALFGSVLLFGLPLLSSDLIGKPLQPISSLKTESDAKHIKVYCYDFIAPEMIWQYGDKISMVKKDSLHYNFPKEKQFGLLVNELNHRDSVVLLGRYHLQKTATYNLNYKAQTHKGQRLINDFLPGNRKIIIDTETCNTTPEISGKYKSTHLRLHPNLIIQRSEFSPNAIFHYFCRHNRSLNVIDQKD